MPLCSHMLCCIVYDADCSFIKLLWFEDIWVKDTTWKCFFSWWTMVYLKYLTCMIKYQTKWVSIKWQNRIRRHVLHYIYDFEVRTGLNIFLGHTDDNWRFVFIYLFIVVIHNILKLTIGVSFILPLLRHMGGVTLKM